MNQSTGAVSEHLPGALQKRVDRACDEFESAWLAGRRPTVEDYLGDVTEPERSALVRELLLLEVDYRHRAGEATQPEDYLTRFPTLDPVWINSTLRLSSWRESALPVVPGYEVVEELGRGGMGVVYKARQTILNRLVALKMIRGGEDARPEQVARFRAEAEAVAQLEHPNIVHIYEVGSHQGRPFLSLELVQGGSLADYLRGDSQPPTAAARLIATLARAIQHAHERNVIHRDLKPSNILLADGEVMNNQEDGQVGRQLLAARQPKITDFGLAKRLDTQSGQTQSGALLGTPAYMAPEQAAGASRDVGRAADIYALGAILYEMLTGQPPFPAGEVMATLLLVQFKEPAPPSRLRPELPRDLVTITLKCLEKQPSKRYASALQLAEDLERYLAGQTIRARPANRTEKLWRWARRNPGVASLLAALVVVFAAGFAVVWKWQEAEERKTAAYRAEHARKEYAELFFLARNYLAAYQYQHAEEACLQCLPLLEKAVAEFSDRPECHSDLGDILGHLAQIRRDRKELAQARALLDQAIDQQRIALELKPNDSGYKYLLWGHLNTLADVLTRLEEHEAAGKVVEELPAILPQEWFGRLQAAYWLNRCAGLAETDARLPAEGRAKLWHAYMERAKEHMRLAIERGAPTVPHAQEAELLPILEFKGCKPTIDCMFPWGWTNFPGENVGAWSNAYQLLCLGNKGSYFVLELSAPATASYQLGIYFTKNPQCGIVEVSLDDKKVGVPFDAFDSAEVRSGPVAFGPVHLTAGSHRLRFTIVGRNPKASGYDLGIDCLTLEPVGEKLGIAPPRASKEEPEFVNLVSL
jgi:serine/threonine protein kinase